MTLFVNSLAQRHLDMLAKDLPQSLLITGEKGVGLLTIALSIAGGDLALVLSPQNSKGQPDEQAGTIAVERIRDLYEQTRSKHLKPHIVIIDDADRMSLGAQAAFLKLLEEPTKNIHFILTSHLPEKLLPTIRSRVQSVTIQRVSVAQTEALLLEMKITDATRRAQFIFIAEGLPAEIKRLASNQDYFAQRGAIMKDARQLLQASSYEKLLLINQYQADRSASLHLVEGMLLIARRSVSVKPSIQLVKQLEKLLDIQAKISSGHNVRLQLARCVL